MVEKQQHDLVKEFCFLALGGVGEIGMNMALYGYGPIGEEEWIMVDCGISFQDSDLPYANVIMPDISFIESHFDQLKGIIITHGHEDHIGALPYLWSRLKAPIYTTGYTAHLIRRKFDQVDIGDVPLEIVDSTPFSVGPFHIQYLALAHSIPEPNALVIETEAGRIVHTGDWRFSHHAPSIGMPVDKKALEVLSAKTIDVLLGDSTSVFQAEGSVDEADLYTPFEAICRRTKGTVIFSCFASNLERLKTIYDVAKAAGREVVVSGRSLLGNMKAAFDSGYDDQFSGLHEESEFSSLPRNRRVVICTGSQGESRAALSRIVAGRHTSISIEPEDVVVFSSRTIPGNEKAVLRLKNALLRQEIEYVDSTMDRVHTSGHASAEEIMTLYKQLKPKCVIPIHGEPMHIKKHEAIAYEAGVPKVLKVYNGDIVRLAPGEVIVEERLSDDEYGRLSLEGLRTVSMKSPIVQSRARAIEEGWAVLSLVLDDDGELLSDISVETVGLLSYRDDRRLIKDLTSRIEGRIHKMERSQKRHIPTAEKAVKQVAARFFKTLTNGRSPMVIVHIHSLDD